MNFVVVDNLRPLSADVIESSDELYTSGLSERK